MKLSKKSLLSQKYTEEFVYFCCRTPQGVRGLKYQLAYQRHRIQQSHPARGAWIEMVYVLCIPLLMWVAPRKGCVD